MKAIINKPVMLLGANSQSMLVVARELSVAGYIVDVADWQAMPAMHSAYIRKYHILYDVTKDAKRFVSDLYKVLEANAYAFVIPINDAALEVCVNFKSIIESVVDMRFVPHRDTYEYAHNKFVLVKIAEELGIPVPEYYYVDSLAEFESIINKISYPVVIKPIFSKQIINNKLQEYTVKIVHNESSLVDSVRELIAGVPVMLQQYVEGYGAGYNIIATKGEIVAAYQHERINEPVGGGASSYRKTNPINTYNLKDYSEKLISRISWTGPAMIEFKISNGVPYVMEMNGRFWGSLALGVFAGINYPLVLVDVMHNNKVNYSEINQVYCARNIKMDIRNAIAHALKQKSLYPLMHLCVSLFKTFKKNEIIEDSLCRDFKPQFYTYFSYLNAFFQRGFQKFKFDNLRKQQQIPVLRSGMKILFVCYGNIYRSPFAEKYAQQHYGNIYNFESCGFHKQENRMSPVSALNSAKNVNVDLSKHLSKSINLQMVFSSDVIFVMDKENYFRFKKDFKNHLSKVYFLGGTSFIEDPYSKSITHCTDVYNIIIERINTIFSKTA